MALDKNWEDYYGTPLSAAAMEDLEARTLAEIIVKIAAIARSSGSAAATEDALRRLGLTASDAAAGNDSRIPTQDENDSLTGAAGTPSGVNRVMLNDDTRIPTQAENDALVGTSGAPGATNRYGTEQAATTHAALKTGTHGIPAMTTGAGLLWNGSDWVSTDLATQTELDTHVNNAAVHVGQPRQVKVVRTVAQPIANVAIVTVAWDSESFDLPAGSNQHDNVTNNTRLTCVEAGLYAVVLDTNWALNNTGQRNAYIRLNGTIYIAVDERGAFGAGSASLSPPPIRLVVGDYVEVQVYQTSGAALNFEGTYGFGWARIGA